MKLTRLLHVTGRSAAGADRVRVTLKLDAPGRHALVLGRQESCSARASTRLRTVRTDARGRVSVTLARPPRGAGPAAYRLWTSGRPITFSLPIVVRARP